MTPPIFRFPNKPEIALKLAYERGKKDGWQTAAALQGGNSIFANLDSMFRSYAGSTQQFGGPAANFMMQVQKQMNIFMNMMNGMFNGQQPPVNNIPTAPMPIGAPVIGRPAPMPIGGGMPFIPTPANMPPFAGGVHSGNGVNHPISSFGQQFRTVNDFNVQNRLNAAGHNMGAVFNTFAAEGGQAPISGGALNQVMNRLADQGGNLSLNFRNGQGQAWVDQNFRHLSPQERNSIKASLQGIANFSPDNTLTMHDIGNAKTAAAILGDDPKNMTADNMRIIQTAIDNGRHSGGSNANTANEIVNNLRAKGVQLHISAADIKAILDAGDNNRDGQTYNDQVQNGTQALRQSAN